MYDNPVHVWSSGSQIKEILLYVIYSLTHTCQHPKHNIFTAQTFHLSLFPSTLQHGAADTPHNYLPSEPSLH